MFLLRVLGFILNLRVTKSSYFFTFSYSFIVPCFLFNNTQNLYLNSFLVWSFTWVLFWWFLSNLFIFLVENIASVQMILEQMCFRDALECCIWVIVSGRILYSSSVYMIFTRILYLCNGILCRLQRLFTWTIFPKVSSHTSTKQDWHQYPVLWLGEQKRYPHFLVGSYLFLLFNLLSSCPAFSVFVGPGVSVSWRHERDIWSVCVFKNVRGEFRECAVLYFGNISLPQQAHGSMGWCVYRLNPIILSKMYCNSRMTSSVSSHSTDLQSLSLHRFL